MAMGLSSISHSLSLSHMDYIMATELRNRLLSTAMPLGDTPPSNSNRVMPPVAPLGRGWLLLINSNLTWTSIFRSHRTMSLHLQRGLIRAGSSTWRRLGERHKLLMVVTTVGVGRPWATEGTGPATGVVGGHLSSGVCVCVVEEGGEEEGERGRGDGVCCVWLLVGFVSSLSLPFLLLISFFEFLFYLSLSSPPLVSVGVCQECVSEVCHECVRSVSGVSCVKSVLSSSGTSAVSVCQFVCLQLCQQLCVCVCVCLECTIVRWWL